MISRLPDGVDRGDALFYSIWRASTLLRAISGRHICRTDLHYHGKRFGDDQVRI